MHPVGQQLILASKIPVATDPFWANVFFASDFEGANNSQANFNDDTGVWTISRAAGAGKLSSTQALFGGTSAFTGSGGQGWVTGTGSGWNFVAGASDAFTWEFAFFRETAIATQDMYVIDTAGGSINTWVRLNAGPSEIRYLGSLTGSGFPVDLTTSSSGIVANAWNRVCIERNSSGVIRIYVGGVMKAKSASGTSTLFPSSSLRLKIGEAGGQTTQNTYTDTMRITKGVARYNSDSGYTLDIARFPTS